MSEDSTSETAKTNPDIASNAEEHPELPVIPIPKEIDDRPLVKKLFHPPPFMPSYLAAWFAAQDQKDWNRARIAILDQNNLEKFYEVLTQKYKDQQQEVRSRLAYEEERLTRTERLFTNMIQYSLAFAAVMAALANAWGVSRIGLPLGLLIASVISAQYYLTRRPSADRDDVNANWFANRPEWLPEKMLRHIYPYLLDKQNASSIAVFANWLHAKLWVPIIFLIAALILFAISISV